MDSLKIKLARKRELSSKILYWEGQLKQAQYYLERYNDELKDIIILLEGDVK